MKAYAKRKLKEVGIKVFQKDIESVDIHKMSYIAHDCGEGLEPDVVPHRLITFVKMKDGTSYEILEETVDKAGNFSTDSAVFKVKEVRKK